METQHLYYFFSSASQVLGAVLGLFGIFIVFKIQVIKEQLLGIAQSILDEIPTIKYKDGSPFVLLEGSENESITRRINKSIHRKDIKELKSVLELIKNQHFGLYLRKYNEIFEFLESLIKHTIILTIVTSIVIVASLLVIPIIPMIEYYNSIIWIMIIIFITSIALIFTGLIYILIKSLKDNTVPLFPN